MKKGHVPKKKADFFWLTGKAREPACAMRKEYPPAAQGPIRQTLEELCDIRHYGLALVLVLAKRYEIDMEKWIPLKKKHSNEEYGYSLVFGPQGSEA